MVRELVILSCIFLLVSAGFSTAQNLVFIDSISGTVLNGQTLTVAENDLNITHEIYIKTKNVSGSAKTVKVKRYETNVLANTQNYFCWTNCYAPVDAGTLPVWTDPFSVIMIPDSLYANFSAYYIPMGIAGASSFRYILFDVNNPNDSSFVDIVFDITVGNEEIIMSPGFGAGNFRVFPNPASDNISFSIKNNEPGKAEIKITNILGEIVREEIISTTGGGIVSLRNLNRGVYFCSYFSDDKIISTRRIVISR